MLTLNDSVIMNDELQGCLVLEYVWGETAESRPVTLTITWVDFKPESPKYKEAGVVTSAVLFGEIQQNRMFVLFSYFLNLQETQRKTKENTGRKHTKESTKQGRDETEIIERDAEKI
jgi:hypothetical protein